MPDTMHLKAVHKAAHRHDQRMWLGKKRQCAVILPVHRLNGQWEWCQMALSESSVAYSPELRSRVRFTYRQSFMDLLHSADGYPRGV